LRVVEGNPAKRYVWVSSVNFVARFTLILKNVRHCMCSVTNVVGRYFIHVSCLLLERLRCAIAHAMKCIRTLFVSLHGFTVSVSYIDLPLSFAFASLLSIKLVLALTVFS